MGTKKTLATKAAHGIRRAIEAGDRIDPAPGRPRAGAAALTTLVLGAPMLRAALNSPSDSPAFRSRTIALAGTWLAGAAATGQFSGDRWRTRRTSAYAAASSNATPGQVASDLVRPAATAAGAVALFAAGALVVTRVPVLRREIDAVLKHSESGSTPLVLSLALLTGAAEEIFFRGTIPDLAREAGLPPVLCGTAVYGVTTCATGNPLLVLASVVLGALAGSERERSGGLAAPLVVHLGWTVGMVELLPRISARARRTAG